MKRRTYSPQAARLRLARQARAGRRDAIIPDPDLDPAVARLVQDYALMANERNVGMLTRLLRSKRGDEAAVRAVLDQTRLRRTDP